MIIGLTGKNGGGKGEVAAFLTTSGYTYFSLSDILRETLQQQNKQVTRDHLVVIGNELRSQFGAGVLAERTLTKIAPDMNAVVDSIRNPMEVEVLRRLQNFHLIAVTADPKIRFERIQKRNRESDPQTYEAFLELEKKEAQSQDATAQQLNRTEDMADAVIVNDETIEVLHQKIREVIQGLVANRPRPSWDHYFMNIAIAASTRSNCIKRRVAAVIVKDQRIVSTGYNGTPRGIRNCNEGGCPRCNHFGPSGVGLDECLCSHAEENAIVQAAYHGVSLKDAILYTTFSPCLMCTKMILNSGIKEVVYNRAYSIADVPFKLFKEAKVVLRALGEEEEKNKG